MRAKEKRGRGIPPLAIRALGVLAISLMAMTSSLASSAGVPVCPSDCNVWGDWTCFFPPEKCAESNGHKCVPEGAVPPHCLEDENCRYSLVCRGTACTADEGGPYAGLRADCVLEQGR